MIEKIKIHSYQIFIKSLKVNTNIGINFNEKIKKQTILFDIKIKMVPKKLQYIDNLKYIINYYSLVKLIIKYLYNTKINIMETLLKYIIFLCFRFDIHIKSIFLTVKKLNKQKNNIKNKIYIKAINLKNNLKIKKENKLFDKNNIKDYFNNVDRKNYKKTFIRFNNSLKKLTSGYNKLLYNILNNAIFYNIANNAISQKNIYFYSLCEHHLLPFYGNIEIIYWANKKIIGLSKITRIIKIFSQRLQLQEKLINEIARAVIAILEPKGLYISIKAKHLCLSMRGVTQNNIITTTIFKYGIL